MVHLLKGVVGVGGQLEVDHAHEVAHDGLGEGGVGAGGQTGVALVEDGVAPSREDQVQGGGCVFVCIYIWMDGLV